MPMGKTTDQRLLLLHEFDNVRVATSRLHAGEHIVIDGASALLVADVPIGHKLARWDIEANDKIVKYGAPIGVATTRIEVGSHVHVHNVRSDYTPTYHLEDVRIRSGGAS